MSEAAAPGRQPAAGTELLEASAGTGKTHAIVSRATLALAHGQARIDQLAVLTFARAAAEELGERVRTQLHRSVEGLTVALAGGTPEDHVEELYRGTPAELGERRDRLRAALGAFDEATVTTIHTFCSTVLRALGVLADFDPEWTLRETFGDLITQIVDDTYLARYRRVGRRPLTVQLAAQLGPLAAYAGQVRTPPATDQVGQEVETFVRSVHEQYRSRKRRAGLLDYDDLQFLLREALMDPAAGSRACQALRERYRLVLVDEFQDTDPVQWDILRTAFHGHVPLVLVGDPKQAIYAFRGGDVATYLRARSQAGHRSELAVNWRSDADLVAAVCLLMGGRALGDPAIRVGPMQARHRQVRIRGVPAAVRIRALRTAGTRLDGPSAPRVGEVRPVIVADLVAQVQQLLTPDGDGQQAGVHLRRDGGRWRPLAPGDIAVLVPTNARATEVQEGLLAAGVPAVRPGDASVLQSRAADQWNLLLDALAQPSHQARLRAAALSVFVGWEGDRLAAAEDVEEVSDLLSRWGRVLAESGIGALFDVLCTHSDLPARVLARPDGERMFTDLRHLTEVLQAQEVDSPGAPGLAAWLTARRGAAPDASGKLPVEVIRRLESDVAAVKVMTIHSAKGLEFPVVLLPFQADQADLSGRERPLSVQHVTARTVSYPPDPGLAAEQAAADAGERRRQLYVALTRACQHMVVWWAPSTNTRASAWHSVLFDPHDQAGAATPPLPRDDTLVAALAGLGERSQGTISAELFSPPAPVAAPGPPAAEAERAEPTGPELTARVFSRSLDLRWRRTSYTGLTADAQHGGPLATSEPEHPGIQDEPDEETAAPLPDLDLVPGTALVAGVDLLPGTEPEADADLQAGGAVPMAELPGGPGFGTLVHAVLEHFDPAAAPLPDHLAELTAHQGRLGGLTPEQSSTLAQALTQVVHTPLGALAGGRCLAQIPRSDRLDELAFELPLAGGDRVRPSATLADLADLIQTHLPPQDPLVAYPDHLRAPELAGQDLRGYLSGSIDAVLRVHQGQGHPRYLVVDYKTNRLAAPEQQLRAAHYLPGPMGQAMMASHYPLQALLYQVALHRYLRFRQPGYRPDTHLGGVLYLFVRGMLGPTAEETPPTGVFTWQPPAGLVEQASALLAGHLTTGPPSRQDRQVDRR